MTSMSTATPHSGRSTVASRTTFEALPVDSGEDSEEDQVAAQPTPPPERSVYWVSCADGIHVCQPSEHLKPSKSAIKKAAKTARTEKRLQQKAAKTWTSDILHSKSESSVQPATAYEPIKVMHESYEIIPVAPEPSHDGPGETPPVDPPLSQPDGDVHKYDDLISSPEPSYPTSMETSGRNSPDHLGASDSGQQDPLNEELRLALQNKLNQEQAAERTKKKQNAITRTLWGFIMIGGFIGKFSNAYTDSI
jgi:phosphatidate cytidylyltransferase